MKQTNQNAITTNIIPELLENAKKLRAIIVEEGIKNSDSYLYNAVCSLCCTIDDLEEAMYKDFGIIVEVNWEE